MWISNSDIAGVFLVMANANPSAVSFFLLLKYLKKTKNNLIKYFLGIQRNYNIYCRT